MEFDNKIIINVDHIVYVHHEPVNLLFTEPLEDYEPIPEYVPSAYIQINLS